MAETNREWTERNVDNVDNTGGVMVSCGHNHYEWFIPIVNDKPQMSLRLCEYCYNQLMGFFIARLTTAFFN
ncbi:MAG: hypothetical protein ACYTFW_00190 [Planctomycetota bacterium]|jgi:hypothetical protein